MSASKPADPLANFEAEYEEKMRYAVDELAPRVIMMLELLGTASAEGYSISSQNFSANYNPLLGTVTVHWGPTAVFAVNIVNKFATVYRPGVWLDFVKEQFDTKLNTPALERDAKRRRQFQLRELFGFPRV